MKSFHYPATFFKPLLGSFGFLFLLFFQMLVPKANCQALWETNKQYPDFESRKKLLLDSISRWAEKLTLDDFMASDDFKGGKYGAYPIMALFETGKIEKAREFVAQQLVGGAAMFREFSTMALYMQYHHLYGEELCEKVKKDQLKSNFFDSKNADGLGGASENHKLMYASAAYLAGLAWPGEYPEKWSQTGYNHLMNWFNIVTSIGFWEEDSPTYLIHHMGPILAVADHAPEGSEMKKRATMVLDWYFASIAGEYLHGYWITSSARDYNPMFGLANSAESSALTWLYFGDTPQVPYAHVHQTYYHWKAALHFAVSHYKLPEILQRIATDRKKPFVHREFMAKNPMEPKEYCYVAPGYGIASIMGENGRIVPNQTRWKVQWVAAEPQKEPSVFFMKHPNEKDEWEKWRGASSAEQVLQHNNTLIAVYKIDATQKPFIDGPFIEKVFNVVKRQNDWLFMHTGACLLAVKAVNGLEIIPEKRTGDSHGRKIEFQVLRSEGVRNGLIVETASLSDYKAKSPEKALDLFIKKVLAKSSIDASMINSDTPRLAYTSVSGDLLEIEFNNYKKVNGKDLDQSNWPLLGNPWMHQDVKGSVLKLEHGGETYLYDFENWKIEKKK